MTDPATGQRSFLQALKVPFDLKGVGAGALAYLALVWGGRLLHEEFGPFTFLQRLGRDGFGRGNAEFLQGWVGGHLLLKLGIAALFGVACCRIAAMRLARDEGVDLGAALGFSCSTLPSTLGAYLFMAAAIAFFFSCNALAGLASGIPGIGPILMIVLVPLVLLSTLILFLLVFGTALGLPLVLASLATERNGALDAVSRGFSYVFSRPALFFFYGATVWFLASLLAACAVGMEGLASASFTRWLPADSENYDALRSAFDLAGTAAVTDHLPDFSRVGGVTIVGAWSAWFFGTLFHLCLMGYVVYYFFGGATAAYFALRRDVDGTEDEEIWVEGEDRDAFGEPEKPEPVPASSPPASATGKAPDAKPPSQAS